MVLRTFGTVGRLKATPQTEVTPSALNLSLVDPFAHVAKHGRTTSVHLSLRSALQGEDLASLKQGAVLEKSVWIAYP